MPRRPPPPTPTESAQGPEVQHCAPEAAPSKVHLFSSCGSTHTGLKVKGFHVCSRSSSRDRSSCVNPPGDHIAHSSTSHACVACLPSAKLHAGPRGPSGEPHRGAAIGTGCRPISAPHESRSGGLLPLRCSSSPSRAGATSQTHRGQNPTGKGKGQ